MIQWQRSLINWTNRTRVPSFFESTKRTDFRVTFGVRVIEPLPQIDLIYTPFSLFSQLTFFNAWNRASSLATVFAIHFREEGIINIDLVRKMSILLLKAVLVQVIVFCWTNVWLLLKMLDVALLLLLVFRDFVSLLFSVLLFVYGVKFPLIMSPVWIIETRFVMTVRRLLLPLLITEAGSI